MRPLAWLAVACCCCSTWVPAAPAVVRTHFIAIREVDWDYAPARRNLIADVSVDDDEHAGTFMRRGPRRVGTVYTKAVYEEYADAAFSLALPKEPWLGFLGPVLRAEVGDTVVVHLRNLASRPYTIHSHGLHYDKSSEGAPYPDHTERHQQADDAVAPGESREYTWSLKPEYGPTEADPACITWTYHSHVDAPRDIAAGLIGPLLACKKGSLDEHGNPQDPDRAFFLLFSVMDENLSWYLQRNVERFCEQPATVDVNDEDFVESNKMHAINGYVYGNAPRLELCAGERVWWHLVAMGNEADVHAAHFLGHTLEERGRRVDTVALFPATFRSARMAPARVGTWLISCQVNDHVQAGMMMLYTVRDCGLKPPGPAQAPVSGGVTRTFFVAAQEEVWDYAPGGRDRISGTKLDEPGSPSAVFLERGPHRVGSRYWKARYVAYEDDLFSAVRQRGKNDEHLALLGPVLRVEVGDVLQVVFWNNASRPYSIQPHGVSYLKQHEGAAYSDGVAGGESVAPGRRFLYRWVVGEESGPAGNDPDCVTWLYYSAADSVRDTNSGLVGPLVVCRPGKLGADGAQRGIDHEFSLLFSVFDENLSWYLERNIAAFASDPAGVNRDDDDFQESNKMHAINGRMYNTLQGLRMCKAQQVSWHLLGLGSEVDVHAVYLAGNTMRASGRRRDTINLFPHSSLTATMSADKAGDFGVVCKTADHLSAGMKQHYHVSLCDARVLRPPRPTATRTHFVAAVELSWDYSPTRHWELARHNTTRQHSHGETFLRGGTDRIGSAYKKVVYREFTDDTFTREKPRGEREKHLGIMGPMLRAEVGEALVVVFKNMASRPYNMHAHGVDEGLDSCNIPPVAPGRVEKYKWMVPERSGPGKGDPDCLLWAYYSNVNPNKDLYSGLFGSLLTCRPGVLSGGGGGGGSDGAARPRGVEREFALLWMVFDENESWYLEENVQRCCGGAGVITSDEDFKESNKMHSINGYVYGNLPGLTMREGEHVAWYLLGMGNEVDIHTVHFHGHPFTVQVGGGTHRADVMDLFPATFETAHMRPGNPGTWLMHCHVTDHIQAGMEATYTVLPRGTAHKSKAGIKQRR
ncbi:hephaestin-like [Lampetra fluviatilis]